MARVFQDDLVSLNSARLRAEGVIVPGAASAVVCFGEGEDALKREVRLWHRVWTHGRGISLFICPHCRQRAQILRVYDGALRCRNCLKRAGIMFRIAYGTRAERAAARAARIEKLMARLMAPSLRVDGRGLGRRRELEQSLRRAKIMGREGLLEEAKR